MVEDGFGLIQMHIGMDPGADVMFAGIAVSEFQDIPHLGFHQF
jgi:hypothetical protein